MSHPEKKRTITSIAQEVGLSQPTVSNILNGKGRVSERMRVKVLNLLNDAGYRPVLERKPFFHVIFTSGSGGMFSEIPMRLQVGAKESFNKDRLTLQSQYVSHNDNFDSQEQVSALINQRPLGIMADSEDPRSKVLLDLCEKEKIPVVLVGQHCSDTRFSSVVIDCLGAIRRVVGELARTGHRRIAFVRWNPPKQEFANSKDKLTGYRLGLEDNNLPYDQRLILDIHSSPQNWTNWSDGPRHRIEKLIGTECEPTAVIVDNSYICPQMILPIASDNGRFPHWLNKLDVAIYGDDNTYGNSLKIASQLSLPSKNIYNIEPNWIESGRLAAEELVNLAKQGRKNRMHRSISILPKISPPHSDM